MRRARSRSSWGYFLGADMAPSSPGIGASINPGANHLGSSVIASHSSQAHLTHVSTLYPASSTEATGGGASLRLPGSCCLSATGVGFLGHPAPAEGPAFLTVGFPDEVV